MREVKLVNKSPTNFRGLLFTAIAAICWGFSGACGEFLFHERNVSTDWVTVARMLVSGVVLISGYLYFKGPKALMKPLQNKGDLLYLILFSLVGLAGCQYTYLMAIQHSNAGTGTMLQYMAPVLVMMMMCIYSRRFPRFLEIVSIVSVFSGVFFVATHGQIDTLELTPLALTFGILAAITLAIYTVMPGRLIRAYGSTLVTAWAMLFGGIGMFIIFRPGLGDMIFDLGTFLGLCGLILVGTVFSYTMFLYGVSLLGPVKASMIACIEPISASIFSALWLGTKFMKFDYLGFTLIIAAVIIVSFSGVQAEEEKAETKE